jgi:hypothetical protein
MKSRLFFFFFATIFYQINELHAQSQFSGWIATFTTIKTGKKTSFINDMQWRSSDRLHHTQTLLLRGGLSMRLSSHSNVAAGYAFIQSRRTSSGVTGHVPEHRTWQQFIYTHRTGPVYTSHRFRLEQRFLARTAVMNNELKREGFNYANRFRYFIRNLLPFHRQKSFSKGGYAALQNEVFLNFGNTNNTNGKIFDQNRFYTAIGFRVSPEFDIEAGYLNQYVNGRGSSFTNNHVAQLAGYLRL